MIDTRLVYGFLDAGKTTYIEDCILNDYFYKYGTTLILCFEQGEAGYDAEKLLEKRTHVAYFDGREDVSEFCRNQIKDVSPDRIYVEMNSMMPELRKKLPAEMDIKAVVTWIDWSTMALYLANFRQMMGQMVSESRQITFRGCPSRELLSPYSQAFRLMNRNASYLREDPMGYHEKAFDLFLPYSLEEEVITVSAEHYLAFWLDAAEHPEHYEGKKLSFTGPLELRRITDTSPWFAGRVVMTCCMADLQFMSFELLWNDLASISGGWITLDAHGETGSDEYGRKVLKLTAEKVEKVPAPEKLILLPAAGY